MEDLHFEQINSNLSFSEKIADFIRDHLLPIDKEFNSNIADEDFFRKKIPEAISKKEYSLAIQLLIELKDYNQGIKWQIVNDNNLTNRTMIIRDARKSELPSATIEPYVVMAINNLRAAKALLPEKKLVEEEEYLALLIRNFYVRAFHSQASSDVLTDLSNYNTVLISILSYNLNIQFDEALQRLNIAKDFVNLEDPSKDIVTLFNLKNQENEDVTVFQADCPICELTPNIKNEYTERRTKIWYQILPEWKKLLVDKYVPAILSEKCVLPTQLRVIPLVGLRNWYEAINGIILDDKALVTSHAYHSGTIVALGPNEEENKRISLLHGQQLKRACGKTVIALTLNSSVNPTGNDGKIVDYSQYTADSLGIMYANLPLNNVRRISINEYSGIVSLLQLASSVPSMLLSYSKGAIDEQDINTLEQIQLYLKNKENTPSNEANYVFVLKEKMRNLKTKLTQDQEPTAIAKIKELCDIIELALTICFLIHNNKNVLDADNRNLTLGCYTNLLVYKLEPFLGDVAINSSCESGKDRDGILMFRTALISFNQAIFGSYSLTSSDINLKQIIRNNIVIMAGARHLQLLAGWQGGTPGAFGIKADSKGALPETEFPAKASEFLIEKTASFNKKIPVCKDKDLIFFPIGNTNPSLQYTAIYHVLTLQQQKLEANLLESGTLTLPKRFSTLFKNDTIMIKRSYLLANTISQLKELPKGYTLYDLYNIIELGIHLQTRLTEGKPHGLGSTVELLKSILENLRQVAELPSNAKPILNK